MDVDIWTQVQSFGLGGMGWGLFFGLIHYHMKLRAEYTANIIKQRDEAIERARLLEQRLFDLKASLLTVE